MNNILFNASLRSNCLGEFIDSGGVETVLYVQFNDEIESIEFGTVCNSGMVVEGLIEYDEDFSLDQNLQALLEVVYELGYTNLQ